MFVLFFQDYSMVKIQLKKGSPLLKNKVLRRPVVSEKE
jgi:hypothetical protein